MSRQSEARKTAKKARRRKRRTAQSTWVPESEHQDNAAADAIGEAVADIDDWITARGWVLDDNVQDLVNWVYPPSAASFGDQEREPVTRIWITVVEDDDEVVLEFGAALVGAGGDDAIYVLDPDALADEIAALENYRPGLPKPELA